MQFFYKVGDFSSGYSSVHVMKATGSPTVITYPSLDVTANGNTNIVIQVNSSNWRMNNSGVNNGAATSLFDTTASNGLSINTHGVLLSWSGHSSTARFVGGNWGDVLEGGSGNDTLEGGSGHDSLTAGAGNDSLLGGNNNDTLLGGDGNDTLSGGADPDVLDGGNGNDVFLDPNGDTITTFEAADTIRLTNGAAQALTTSHLQYDSTSKTLTIDFDKNGTFGGGSDVVVTFTNAPATQSFQVNNTGGFADITLAPPSLSSASYDAGTGVLAVTVAGNVGVGDTIAVNKLTLSGEGNSAYTLTSSDVTTSSASAFSVTLNAADQAAVNQILNKAGTSATGGATFNLAGAAGWNSTANAPADLTDNGVTVSNPTIPTITSASYSAATGVLTVTGSGFLQLAGANNDITVSKFTVHGDATDYTLTSSNVDISSGTSFTVTLNAADQTALASRVNKSGTSSIGSVTYNLAAAEDWAAGAEAAVTVADLTGNSITALLPNVAPTITSAASASVAENTVTSTVVYTATANDPESDTLSYSLTGADAASFSINATTGQVRLLSPADYETQSSYSLNIMVSDTASHTSSQALTVSVSNVNEKPQISAPATQNVTQGVATALTGISLADPDAGSSVLTLSVSGEPGVYQAISGNGVTVSGSGSPSITLTGSQSDLNAFLAAGQLSGTMPAGMAGPFTISLDSDDGGHSGTGSAQQDSKTLTVTGVPGNAAPVITSGASASVAENTATSTVVYTATATDAESDTADLLAVRH